MILHNVLCSFQKAIESLGFSALSHLKQVWAFSRFLMRLLIALCTGRFYGRQWLIQIKFMAFDSLLLIALTSLFTGMVLALQAYHSFRDFSPIQVLPDIVSKSLTRELGPVLSGLMMAGRWGASIAAQLGSMRVTDQMDALFTLSTHPLRYLVIPRICAAVLALPFLVLVADIIGIFGGALVSVNICHTSWAYYLSKVISLLKMYDVGCGVLKGACFGLIIALIGCFYGDKASGGAQGVGHAATQGVVLSSILILCANYFLTAYFFQ